MPREGVGWGGRGGRGEEEGGGQKQGREVCDGDVLDQDFMVPLNNCLYIIESCRCRFHLKKW